MVQEFGVQTIMEICLIKMPARGGGVCVIVNVFFLLCVELCDERLTNNFRNGFNLHDHLIVSTTNRQYQCSHDSDKT